MSIGKPEWETQRRIIKLFREQLDYKYLGDWSEREANSNIEEGLLTAYLKGRGYADAVTSRAIYKLNSVATDTNKDLYHRNQAVYDFLRYGIQVDADFGKPKETVWLINWNDPTKNHFGIAEEVTLKGGHERRPDLVLYINGLAMARLNSSEARFPSARASTKASRTSRKCSMRGSILRSNSSSPEAIRKACSMARLAHHKNSF